MDSMEAVIRYKAYCMTAPVVNNTDFDYWWRPNSSSFTIGNADGSLCDSYNLYYYAIIVFKFL